MTTHNVPLTTAFKSFLDLSTVLSCLSDFHFWTHSVVRLTPWLFIEAHVGIQNLLIFYTDSFQNQLELVAVLSLCAKGISWALARLNLPLNAHSPFRWEGTLSPLLERALQQLNCCRQQMADNHSNSLQFCQETTVIVQLSLTIRDLGAFEACAAVKIGKSTAGPPSPAISEPCQLWVLASDFLSTIGTSSWPFCFLIPCPASSNFAETLFSPCVISSSKNHLLNEQTLVLFF